MRQLQRDINAGSASQDIQIVSPQKLVTDLQSNVDAAQTKYNANPSRNNKNSLDDANKALGFAIRDGECLIKGCAPAAYIQWPNGTTPQVPTIPPTIPKP